MSNNVVRKSNFTTVQNLLLRDNNLSFKAKGLFCYMSSMSKDWNFTIASIAKQQKDGIDSIKSAMKELKEYGYMTYTKHTNGTGTYTLIDEPKVENPNVENPYLGKSTCIKKEKFNKNKNTKIPANELQEKVPFDKFQLIWKKYTLDFLKEKFNRRGGNKQKAKKGFETLINKGYSVKDIADLVSEEHKLDYPRDLERVLSLNSMKQFIEDRELSDDE